MHSQTQKKAILAPIHPHLVELRDLLDELERLNLQDDCAGFESEYTKRTQDICGDYDNWYDSPDLPGMLTCFRCVFLHYGLELPYFGDVDRTKQIARFRQLLSAYLTADNRLRALLQNCDGSGDFNGPSVIDYLLGHGLLDIEYSATGQYGLTDRTSGITLPEYQFDLAEQSSVGYQTIGFLLTHELGHIFHNRLQQVVYVNEQNALLKVTMANGEVTLPSGTPGAVRDYLQAVGGYYTDVRDFDYPAVHPNSTAVVALTSLNFCGVRQPLDIYEGSSGIIREEVRNQYLNRRILIRLDGNGSEYVYLLLDGTPVNEDRRILFIEASTYIPDFSDVAVRDRGTYFPNESRHTSEPKEGFADSFAAYILQPEGLENTSRVRFFDQHMQDWLCQLLQAGGGS